MSLAVPSDSEPVEIILRPDIENRNFHTTTKAYTGPETLWPTAVKAFSDGFDFAPDPEHALRLQMDKSAFVWEPEWQYMVYRSQDAQRGQDPGDNLHDMIRIPKFYARVL